jgi:glycosyltransferase involved in cell wall biosynthesis
MRRQVDVLLIRGDTTLGLRLGDDSLAAALRRAGCSVAEVTPEYRIRSVLIATHLMSRIGILSDLVESLEARTATTAALKRYAPSCLVFAPWFVSALQPRSRFGPSTAIRFDSPPSMSRRGRRGARVLRALQRRSFDAAGLLLPWGVVPRENLLAALPVGARFVALPVPIVGAGPGDKADADSSTDSGSSVVVTYASSNPHKKGLDLVLGAWQVAAPEGLRLAVAGIRAEHGQLWCKRRGVSIPETVDWVGVLEPDAWRRLLRRSRFCIAASRYEDHGLAQLEVLAQGGLLVTVPSEGPFEALSIAQDLPGELVASHITAAALAEAIGRAASLPLSVRGEYQRSARERTDVYSVETLDERLRNQVLPQLMKRHAG